MKQSVKALKYVIDQRDNLFFHLIGELNDRN
jgi:hypothetical protein